MATVTLSPAQTEIQIIPGATYIKAYTITNNSDTDLSFFTSIESWVPQGTDGNTSFSTMLPKNFNFSLSNSDLNIGQHFTILPKQSKQIILKIKTDPKLTPQDYYLTIFFNQISNLSQNNQNLIKIGSHILISASTEENPKIEASVTKFSTSPIVSDSFFGKINVTGLIQNDSSFFFKPDAALILSKNKTLFKEIKVFPQNVLPSHQRQILCQSPDQKPIVCRFDKPLWPGIYQISIKSDKPHLDSSITIYIFPFSIIIPLIIIFLIIRKLKPNYRLT